MKHHHTHCSSEHTSQNHCHCSCEQEQHSHAHCSCGHSDHDRHDCGCGCAQEHSHREGPLLLVGAILFATGLLHNRWALFFLIPAYLLLGFPVLKNACKNLLSGHVFDENFLMSLATIGAFCIQEYPEAVGIMLFYRVGEYFEHRATARSRDQIMAAIDMRPDVVTLEDGSVQPAEQVTPGTVLIVRPGDRIPLDSVVLTGESRIDTAPVTGESVPIAVGPGSHLISGCMNASGVLTVRVEKPLAESMVTKILNSVEYAAAHKPKIDRFISRFARVYTPIVVVIAVITAVLPSLITGDWHYWFYTAISFLVMSCPCALVLSVPLAFFCGIGTGSKQGILFKSGAAMEALAGIEVAALDKTGTLTRGDFRVQDICGDKEILTVCAACEQFSSHPIAKSILKAADNIPLPRPEEIQELSGMGIRATLHGKQVLCGSRTLLAQFSVDAPQIPGTAVYVACDGVFQGYLVIGDTIKEETPHAVSLLKAMGIRPVMVTGDREDAARKVAKKAGIEDIYAGLLPHQKFECIQSLRHKFGNVLFVGDGINDAPVLAGADVGGAMGSGSDGAMDAADIVYMTSRTDAIAQSILLARKAKSTALENVILSLGVKAAVMVLGLLGFANMWFAVLADSGVAMLCVLNSVKLLYQNKNSTKY